MSVVATTCDGASRTRELKTVRRKLAWVAGEDNG
jgi:hypothetical protein